MDKKKEDFTELTLATCLICEKEYKPDENWTKPMFEVMDLYPAKYVVEMPDMKNGGLKQTFRNIYLCKYHYDEMGNKIKKVRGGEIHA